LGLCGLDKGKSKG